VFHDRFWLTTERLGLRHFTPDDFDWLMALYQDPDVMQYLGGPKDRAHVEDLMQARILKYYDEHPGLGIWMTVDRATEAPLGLHVLNNIHGETLIQVGFILAKPAWGQGIASEIGTALVRYGFVDLGLPRIVGITDPANLASQHALMKIGLHRNGERLLPHPAYAADGPQAFFERDAADWLDETGR